MQSARRDSPGFALPQLLDQIQYVLHEQDGRVITLTTQPRFECTDKTAQACKCLRLDAHEFQPKLLPLRPLNHCQDHFYRRIIIRQIETQL